MSTGNSAESAQGANSETEETCSLAPDDLFAAVPWDTLIGERANGVQPPSMLSFPIAENSKRVKTLQIAPDTFLIAGIVPYRGGALSHPAIWTLRCEEDQWRFLGGAITSHAGGAQICMDGAGIAVFRPETVPNVETQLYRVEMIMDTCGSECGSVWRRFALVRLEEGRPSFAFRCLTHDDEYEVAPEMCHPGEGRTHVRYGNGRVRSRRRSPELGPWVSYAWDGEAFRTDRGISDCQYAERR